MHNLLSAFMRPAVGAGLAGALTASYVTLGYFADERREKVENTKLTFSEVNATTRYFAALGLEVPPLRQYKNKAMDTSMKVLEANNLAYADSSSQKGFLKAFAQQLSDRMTGDGFDHDTIREYLRDLPQEAERAKEALTTSRNAARDAAPISSNFARAWDYTAEHVEELEPVTSLSCDTEGNCTTETSWEWEYIHGIITITAAFSG